MRTAVARINGPGGDRCTDDLQGTQAEEAHTARPRKGWSLLPLNLLSMVPERNLVSPRNDGPAGADTGRSTTCMPTHCREFAGENRPGRTVVAPWQEYWYDDQFGKRGEVWAPEVHYFAAWDRTSADPGGGTRYAYDTPGPGRVQYQYDVVAAVSDSFEGPYSTRWTAGVGTGGNNFFVDHSGQVWSTFFRNPNFGYWADPARIADAAVPGVVRLEWTGPQGNRLYVERRNRGRTINS